VADKGINEHVAPDTWDELVGGIVAAFVLAILPVP